MPEAKYKWVHVWLRGDRDWGYVISQASDISLDDRTLRVTDSHGHEQAFPLINVLRYTSVAA